MSGADRPAPLKQRLLRHVAVDANGCWIWQGSISRDGYARIRDDRGRTTEAHRVSYTIFIGPIPDGLTIDHVRARGCRSRACVNPAHLEPVTPRENTLRGDTLAAANAAKTHCDHGHEFTPRNTRIASRGRRCRACETDRSRAYRRTEKYRAAHARRQLEAARR